MYTGAHALAPRAGTFRKIAFTFTTPYLQGFQPSFRIFNVSQTFHTFSVKAM